jgi:two-component system response regulator AtoC
VPGAFPGADEDRPGLLELASGGTLFLDQVGDLPMQLQPKLLRALQEGTIRRVGGKDKIAVDLRLVAATPENLKQAIAGGHFREDLYSRIAAVELQVPRLAERGEDIVLLAEEFLARLNRQHHRAVALGKAAKKAMLAYSWPGNVRELEHVIARAHLLQDGDELDDFHLPEVQAPPRAVVRAEDGQAWPVISLAEAEARTIRTALAHTGGDKTAAAKLLQISRTALYEKLKRIGN